MSRPYYEVMIWDDGPTNDPTPDEPTDDSEWYDHVDLDHYEVIRPEGQNYQLLINKNITRAQIWIEWVDV